MKKGTSRNPNIKKIGQKTRFKKGQSGNPDGRPPGQTISYYYLRKSNDPVDIAIRDSNGKLLKIIKQTRAEAVAQRVWDLAMKGDAKIAWKYLEMIQDRTEGKVSQPIEVKSKLDLSKLSKQELELLKLIHSKAATE